MTKTNTINERIDFIIQERYNGVQKSFADACGIAPTVINNIVSGRKSAPSFEVIQRISTIEDLSLNWLINGVGEAFSKSVSITPTTNPNEGIPLIPIGAWAGTLDGGYDPIMEYDCERYIVPMFKDADFLIAVKGDSMSPRYESGDLIACRNVYGDGIWFQWGKTYVLDTEQGSIVKQVFPGATDNTLKLVSENPKYPPFELNKEYIYRIAIVLGIIRAE